MRGGAFAAFSMIRTIMWQSSRICSFSMVSRKSSTDAPVSLVLTSGIAHFVFFSFPIVSFSFSRQMNSIKSAAGSSVTGTDTVHGFV